MKRIFNFSESGIGNRIRLMSAYSVRVSLILNPILFPEREIRKERKEISEKNEINYLETDAQNPIRTSFKNSK